MTIKIFTEGKVETEPGPATVNIRITDNAGSVILETEESIGNSTEIYAEYFAALRGLQLVLEKYAEQTPELKCEMKLGSETVKKQLNHEEAVTHPGLVPLFIEIHNLQVEHFTHITFSNI